MLCVTGMEASADALAARFAASENSGVELMHEVRLDAVDHPESVLPLLETEKAALLLCCRPTRQGGRYRGDEEERLALIEKAANAARTTDRPVWIDLEADLGDTVLDRFERNRVVLSWHDFDGVPSDLERRLTNMRARGPGVLKLAAKVEDASQLLALYECGRGLRHDHVLIGMGPAGLLSRSHYRSFGSRWCYVAGRAQDASAPGQLSLEQALTMGMPDSSAAPVCALVGGPQVLHSPGPRVYNRLFRARSIRSSYVPLITQQLDRLLVLLEELGTAGLSITMPHKSRALAIARADTRAKAAGAVNSLKPDDRGWIGSNSDVMGVHQPLKRAMKQGASALVLGAGGAARAAVVACRELGLTTTVAARRPAALQGFLTANERAVPWDERTQIRSAVLINATPLITPSPWPDDAALPSEVVFDLALNAGWDRGEASSPLLARATRDSIAAVPAIDMWLSQGAEQMGFFFGERTTPTELRELLT